MVLCSLPLWLLQLLPLINVILTITGVLVGWVYLRFYQQKGKGAKGDLRDGFAFATFFPEPLQYVFSCHFISNKLYSHVVTQFQVIFSRWASIHKRVLKPCIVVFHEDRFAVDISNESKCFVYILNFHICKI